MFLAGAYLEKRGQAPVEPVQLEYGADTERPRLDFCHAPTARIRALQVWVHRPMDILR